MSLYCTIELGTSLHNIWEQDKTSYSNTDDINISGQSRHFNYPSVSCVLKYEKRILADISAYHHSSFIILLVCKGNHHCYNGSHLRSFHKLSHPFVFLTWMIYNIIKFVEERCAVTFQAYDFHLTDDTKGIKSYRLELKEILVCLCSFADIQNEGVRYL